MFIQLLNVGKLLHQYHFEPAKVQRQYIWGEREAALLLDDLLDSYSTNPEFDYYLGPILLAEDAEMGKAWVYDGQQRLTTLTILMAAFGRISALRDESPEKQRAQKLSRNDKRPRLELRTLGGALTRVINGTHQRAHSNNTPADFRIYDIERAFLKRLAQLSEPGQFFDWITKKVVFGVLWVDQSRGLVLFDRANNRGVHLEWHELVKGVISEALDRHSVSSGGFTEQWYRTQREAGREFEDLLWSTAIWRYGRPDLTDTMDKAWAQAAFEDDFGDLPNDGRVSEHTKHFLTQLEGCRKAGEKLDDIRSRDRMIDPDPTLAQLMFLEFAEWKPVAYWILLHKGDEADSALRRLRRSSFIAHLLGWQTRPKWLGEFFLRELEHHRSRAAPYRFSAQQIEQARGALRSSMTDPSQYRPLVKLYEASVASARGCLNPRQLYLAHVEHVLPRAARDAWCIAFPDEDERADLRSRLGNCCLLPKETNQDLSNKNWATKRNVYFGLDRVFVGARDVAAQDQWTASGINDRTNTLASSIEALLEL